MLSIDKEWQNYLCNDANDDDDDISLQNELYDDTSYISSNIANEIKYEIPKSTNIYISTKTKIAYLNLHIDLKNIFWNIPVMPYATPLDGVIKKQIKFNSTNIEELNIIQEKLKKEKYYDDYIITNINNPSGRIKFKDIRKISIGISKKDIMNCHGKEKFLHQLQPFFFHYTLNIIYLI